MAELLRMPEIAAGTDRATLVSWPVAVHEPFVQSDVIAVVETEKAVVDVEAESDGVLVRTLVEPGTDVQVGEPIAIVAAAGETVDDVDALLRSLGVGNGAAAAPVPVSAEPAPPAGPTHAPGPAPADDGRPPRIFSSPLARRLARQAGLSLEELTGTGPNGRILRRDVEKAALARKASDAQRDAQRAEPRPAPQPAQQAGGRRVGDAAPASPTGVAEDATAVPHSKLRRLIAARLTESKQTIPHFYVRASIEVDELLELRVRLNAVSDVRVSVNDLVIKAVAAAHLAVPDANVVWTDEAMLKFSGVDVAVAIAAPKGLVTPVVRGVEKLSITALSRTVRDLVSRAGSGQLRQAELEGASTTVTNLGMYGTEEFAAIINPPHSSILSVGSIAKRPVVLDSGEIAARSTMNVVLSVDHRAIDGALAAEWMRAFVAAVRNPLSAII